MAARSVTRAKPMPVKEQLKFINIWLKEDLNNWLQVYAAHLHMDSDVKIEETAVNEYSKFSKVDYHHLRTLAHLCDIKLKRIEKGLLGKWYDDAMEKAKNDEETQIIIQEQYQKTFALQTKKQAKYRWVINCLKYQKTLRASAAPAAKSAKPKKQKQKKEPAPAAETAPPAENEVPAVVTPYESKYKKADDFAYAKVGARAQNATAATLAALRKRLPV